MSIDTPAASTRASSNLSVRILRALDDRIEPIQVTFGYRLAILVVAALMVLLPIIYISLIGLVGYGVYWHLLNNTGMLQVKVKGKGMLLVLLAYAAPAIIGAILVAFMLKPLFARRQRSGNKPQTIQRADEPFLFEFVDRLCDAVGSPRPTSILLDDNVNAAAALTSGVWNPFRRELMLVVGLPLVAGMTLKQFAGILAHEFGHFSQGTGMRLGGIINSVNRWFAFVVFQRDEWDAQLERWSQELDIRFSWVIYAARGCVWLTRKILHGLMIAGHAMSCRLSREMEFDADRHEARLSGSDTFAQTCHRLPILLAARRWAISDLSESFREGRLVDDFFSLISFRAGQIPDDKKRELIDEQMKSKTGWFDTHPCDADRIASAARESAPGLLQIDAPAAVLFQDFSKRCRGETLKFYQSQIDRDIPEKSLVSLDLLIARQTAEQEEDKAVDRILNGIYHFYWTLPFPDSLEPATDSLDEVLAGINALRQRIPGHREAHVAAIKKLSYNIALLQESNTAEALLQSGITIGANIFTLVMTNLHQVAEVREQATAARDDAYELLTPILQDLADRIVLPLSLLGVPAVAAAVPDAESLWVESQYLMQQEVQLRERRPDLLSVYDSRELVRDLYKQLEGREQNEKFISGLVKAMTKGIATLTSVRENLREIEYPFYHVEEGISVSKYLIEELPPDGYPVAIDGAMSYVANEGLKISSRIVGRLCVIAESVETALGLPPGDPPVIEPKSN